MALSIVPEASPATERPTELHGYSPAQVEQVFLKITEQSEYLRDVLGGIKSEVESTDRFVCGRLLLNSLYLAQQLAVFIGAMADQMTGGQHIGSVASWACGDEIETDDRTEVSHA